MKIRKCYLLKGALAALFVSFGMSSCSCTSPEVIHLDFADVLSIVGPTMGERAAGNVKIDSNVRSRQLFFLINESTPKCYSETVIDGFIDSSKLVQQEIARRYYELRIMFYHRSANTDAMLKFRTDKALTLCNDDIISEYVWRNGQASDTLFYDHGRIRGSEDIKIEKVPKH